MGTHQVLTRRDIDSMLREWLDKLHDFISLGDGKSLCEATRMLLGITSILHAYFPSMLTEETAVSLRQAFDSALQYVEGAMADNNGPDGNYDLYRDNIASRCTDLDGLLAPAA